MVAHPVLAEQPNFPAQATLEEAVSLRYEAAPGCPSEQQFAREISARVRLPVRFSASDATFHLLVRLEKRADAAEFVGDLQIEHHGDSSQREFTASTCDEVASALALVAALTLDPNARTEPIAADGFSAEARSAEARPAEPAPAPAVAADPLPRGVETGRRSPKRPSPPPLRSRVPVTWWASATGEMVIGYAPKPLALLGASVGARAGAPPLSPSLELGGLWGETGVTGPASASGNFAWALGYLQGCPVSWLFALDTRLEPCVALDVGRLSARGSATRIEYPSSARRWWLDAGLHLAVRRNFKALFVRAAASALFPLVRDKFVFNPDNELVHRPSAAGFGAALSVGFEFGR